MAVADYSALHQPQSKDELFYMQNKQSEDQPFHLNEYLHILIFDCSIRVFDCSVTVYLSVLLL